MKHIKLVLTGMIFLLTKWLYSQPGSLDPEFGTGGIVITNLGMNEGGYSLAVQSDAKIVVVGVTGTGFFDYDIIVVRYNTDGSLDNTFGSGGVVITDFGTYSHASSVVLQPDGKIVVAGHISDNVTGEGDFIVIRYNPDGSLDNSFDGDGRLTASINNYERSGSVALQNDGKIIIAGMTRGSTQDEFALIRFNTDGTKDHGFGTAGVVTTSFGGTDCEAYSIAIRPDGNIFAAGVTYNGTVSDFALACYNQNGTLDGGFGSGGIITTDFGTDSDCAFTMDILPDGKIILAGYSYDGITSVKFALVQYNQNGSPDTNFGSSGQVITAVTSSISDAYSINHQSDGKIVVAGRADDGTNCGFAMVRYLPDGSLDNSFGTGGIVITYIGIGYTSANSAGIEPDGKIVVSGSAGNATDADIAVVRYIANLTSVGVLDFSISEESVLVYPNPIGQDAILGYTLTADEYISIFLLDMQGRTLKIFVDRERQEAGKHQQDISLPEELPAGNYLLSISSPEGQMSIQIAKK